MSNFWVCSLCVLTLLPLSSCYSNASDEETRGTIPKYETQMQFEGGLVYLPVSVNNAVPRPFILDTGLNSMILSQTSAQEVGAISNGTTIELQGVNDFITPVEVVRNLLVEVGGLQWALGGAMVAPVPLSQPIEETTGQAFYGMIGAPLFEQYVVTMDFQTQQIQLSPTKFFKYTGTGERLKLSFKGRKPHIKATLQLRSASRPVEGEFLLDLGSNQSLDLRGVKEPSITQDLPQRITAGLGGKSLSPVGRIHSIALGQYQISNPITSFETSKKPSKTKLSGRIGTQILSQFRVIFNYAKKEVIFEPVAPKATLILADMSGLRLILENATSDSTVTVTHVYPQTPAQEAGIQPGDRLLAIHDQPVNILTLHDIRERLIGDPGAIRNLQIQRGEEVFQVQVRLRHLI